MERLLSNFFLFWREGLHRSLPVRDMSYFLSLFRSRSLSPIKSYYYCCSGWHVHVRPSNIAHVTNLKIVHLELMTTTPIEVTFYLTSVDWMFATVTVAGPEPIEI